MFLKKIKDNLYVVTGYHDRNEKIVNKFKDLSNKNLRLTTIAPTTHIVHSVHSSSKYIDIYRMSCLIKSTMNRNV